MVKVCHMTSAHAPEDVRIFYKECVSLANAGYDVYLVERGDTYEKEEVHIMGVGEIPGNRLSRMTRGAKMVFQKAVEVDADVYHFHDPELLPYSAKLKELGKKVIFDSHERYTEQLLNKPYLPAWLSPFVASAYGKYEESILRQIDAVIFPCTLKGQNPFEGQCSRVVFINNAPRLNELYDKYDPNAEKAERAVCYIGSLSKNRGITGCVKSAYQASAELFLAGTFAPSEFQNELIQLPEYSCVEYLGQLNRSGIAELLSKCSIGLCTLLNTGQYLIADNLPTKAYEYMSMGLPVVLSHSSYNDRMTDKYQFGICVNPENVDEIADAIRYLLDHPEEARRMGENGRRAVKTEFNWGVEEKKLLALYEEILKD